MNEIMVSIVCTNYNKGDWIVDALNSFLLQETDFEYEVLVIDDGSTDHSPGLIAEYEKTHPGVVRAFYNSQNLGITKTWKKVCKFAKGKYIARCDGDDYWIDRHKLQQQVELLMNNPDSEWCSTDYDIITPEGQTIQRSAFETGLVDRSSSYAQMLATKGFTMSSTWLVSTELMLEVNKKLNKDAVDDTFNIQLDLFNLTELTYLPKATVVYRVNEGSDSRPTEIEKVISRNKRLLTTQLEYVRKYKNVDYERIIELLLEHDMKNENLAIDRLRLIYDLRNDIESQKKYISKQDTRIDELQKSIASLERSYVHKIRKVATVPARFIKSLIKHV